MTGRFVKHGQAIVEITCVSKSTLFIPFSVGSQTHNQQLAISADPRYEYVSHENNDQLVSTLVREKCWQ